MEFRSLPLVLLILILILASQLNILGQQQWEIFQPKDEEFSIDSPVELRRDGDKGVKSWRKYFGEINGAYLYIFSDPVSKPKHIPFVANFVSSAGSSIPMENGVPVTGKISFQDQYGYWQHISVVISANRRYLAQVVTKAKSDQVADRFLESFRLTTDLTPSLDQSPTTSDEGKETTKPISAPSPAATPRSSLAGSGSGGGIGYGSGSGVGTGTTPPNSSKPVPGQTKPIRILTKPRPNYTDFARFYEITGTVLVRVTFLKSGEIGSATATKTLPFGLTEQAIAAAKRLRFEPAYRDGEATTIVKHVEYSFSIY